MKLRLTKLASWQNVIIIYLQISFVVALAFKENYFLYFISNARKWNVDHWHCLSDISDRVPIISQEQHCIRGADFVATIGKNSKDLDM